MALRATFGQCFALPQGRLRHPIALELLQILIWKTTELPLRVSVIEVARAITEHNANYSSQAGRNVCDRYPEVREKIMDLILGHSSSFQTVLVHSSYCLCPTYLVVLSLLQGKCFGQAGQSWSQNRWLRMLTFDTLA